VPLPWEARSVSCFMTEKSAVKAPASTCGTEADGDAVVEEPDWLEDEPHPARTVPAAATTATAAAARRVVVIDPPSRSAPPCPVQATRVGHYPRIGG